MGLAFVALRRVPFARADFRDTAESTDAAAVGGDPVVAVVAGAVEAVAGGVVVVIAAAHRVARVFAVGRQRGQERVGVAVAHGVGARARVHREARGPGDTG